MNRLLLFLLMLTFLCSCGKKDKEVVENGNGFTQELFIKGDLSAFYEGMELNKKSVINVNAIEKFNKFRLVKFGVFYSAGVRISQDETDEKDTETAEENEESRQHGQEASRENIKDESQLVFSFDDLNEAGEWVYTDESRSYQIFFQEKNGLLEPVKYIDIDRFGTPREIPVKPVHYSISDNGLDFSILIRSYGSEVGALTMFQFSYSDQPKMVEDSKEEFTFLLGPTKKAVLTPKSKIKLCSNVPEWIRKQIKRAFDSWNEIMPEDHISYEVAQSYPPFSDVNYKCIYFIRDFDYSDPKAQNISLGFASTGMHFYKGEIVDTDIVIPVNSWDLAFEARDWGSFDEPNPEKKEIIDEFAYDVISHEIGHMLGLDHSFTDDSKVDSIMSYSANREFTKYDIESIQELYKDFY